MINFERLSRIRELAASGEARRIRIESRLSLPELASAVGVGVSTMSRWERAQRRPQGSAAMRYADVLHALQKRPSA